MLTISVIIPAYNVGDFIAQALSSLVNQDVQPHEIIIVNDGSTDHTLAISQQYAQEHEFIKIITQANQGVGKARDAGLAEATGDFAYFCDPDDYVANDLLSSFATAHAERPDIDLFCFNSEAFDETDYRHRKLNYGKTGWFNSAQYVFKQLVERKSYSASLCLFIFRRNLLTSSGLKFERRVHEDHAVSMWLFMHATTTYTTNQICHFQRIRRGSLTKTTKQASYVIEMYSAYREALSILIKHGCKLSKHTHHAYRKRCLKKMIRICKKNEIRLPSEITRDMRDLAKGGGLGILSFLVSLFPYFFIKLRF